MPEEPNDQPQPNQDDYVSPPSDIEPATSPFTASEPQPGEPTPVSEPVATTPDVVAEVTPQSTPAPTPAPTPTPVAPVAPEPTAVPVQSQQAPQFGQPAPTPTPAPAPAFGQPPVQPTEPKKSKKKWFIIGGIIAFVLILLGAGSALAYNVWYQNPDKVLSDAVSNALRAKTATYTGSLDFTQTGSASVSKFTLTVDGKNTSNATEVDVTFDFEYDDTDYSLSGAGLFDADANLYFKVNDVRSTIDKFSDGEELPEAFDAIITKIDGNWIKVSADDLKEFDEDYAETQTCTKDALAKLENNSDATRELVDLYKAHTFIVVAEELGVQDGSLGYVIEGDEEKAKSFVRGLNDTTIFKELKACDDTFEIDEDDLFSDSSDSGTADGRVELWVSRWSHQFTKVFVTSTNDGATVELLLEPVFDAEVTVTPPSDAVPLSELQQDIEDATESFYSSYYDYDTYDYSYEDDYYYEYL